MTNPLIYLQFYQPDLTSVDVMCHGTSVIFCVPHGEISFLQP